jgi:hypothetical protein
MKKKDTRDFFRVLEGVMPEPTSQAGKGDQTYSKQYLDLYLTARI